MRIFFAILIAYLLALGAAQAQITNPPPASQTISGGPTISATGTCVGTAINCVLNIASNVHKNLDTVSAAQWGSGDTFEFDTTAQTVTLPAISTPLSTNGGIVVQASNVAVTVAVSGTDNIVTAGGTSGNITIPAGFHGLFTTDGGVFHATWGSGTVAPTQTITAGTNVTTSGVCTGTALSCTVNASGTGSGASLTTPQSWTAAQRGTPNKPVGPTTFTPSFDVANNFEIDLSSSCPCTLANPSTALVAGQSGVIEIHQDPTGSRTITTWGSDYRYVGGTSTITLSTAASAVDYLPYYVNNAATAIVLGTLLQAPVH